MLVDHEISELQAELYAQFKLKGFSWQHDRVKAWMAAAGLANRFWMEVEHYEALIRKLEPLPLAKGEFKPEDFTPGLWRYTAEECSEWTFGYQYCINKAEILEAQMSPEEIESDRQKWAAMPQRGDTLETAIARLDSYYGHLYAEPKPKFDPTPKAPEKPEPKPVPKSIQEIVERCKARANATA